MKILGVNKSEKPGLSSSIELIGSGDGNMFLGQFRDLHVVGRTMSLALINLEDIAAIEAGGSEALERLLEPSDNDPSIFTVIKGQAVIHISQHHYAMVRAFQELTPYVPERDGLGEQSVRA